MKNYWFLLILFLLSCKAQAPVPSSQSKASLPRVQASKSALLLSDEEIRSEVCTKTNDSSLLSGISNPECWHYCSSCLGVGTTDFDRYFSKFSNIVWKEWWGLWGLNWLVTLAKQLQTPKILGSIRAANIGTCWAVLIIAIVRAHDYLSDYREGGQSQYKKNAIAKVTCSVIYALSACTAATSFPPISAALKPFSIQITAAMAACSVGELVADKIVCDQTRKTCLGSIENAKPLVEGNMCCCQEGSLWTFDREHPCRRKGGKFKAGTCGFGLPSTPEECSFIP